MSAGNREKVRQAPVTVVIGMDMAFATARACGASGIGIHHALLDPAVLAAARAADAPYR